MTATEDRMQAAFDKAMFHNSPTIMRVQIAADVADQMVAEATAALRKQHAEMLAAAKEVLRGLNARIDAASAAKEPVPVFYGIANLASAIAAAEASGTGGQS